MFDVKCMFVTVFTVEFGVTCVCLIVVLVFGVECVFCCGVGGGVGG